MNFVTVHADIILLLNCL